MKKIFYLLFFTILVAKAFPDEKVYLEVATIEWSVGIDKNPNWKFNWLNIHFLLYFDDNYNDMFDIEITPVIISKYQDMPSYNFSFVNFKIGYNYYNDEKILPFLIKPFLEINYLNLKENIFDFNTLNLQVGVRFGIIPVFRSVNLFFFETGYAYKNNRHNCYFSIGTSPFWIATYIELLARM